MIQQERRPKIAVTHPGILPSQKNDSTRPRVKRKGRHGWSLRILPFMIVVFTLFLTVRAHEALNGFSIGQLYAQQPFADARGLPSTPRDRPAASDRANGNDGDRAGIPPPPAPATIPENVRTVPIGTAPASALSSSSVETGDHLSAHELDLLQKLAGRREELGERARELDRRETLLRAAVLKMDERIGQLKALQNEVDSLLKKYNQQEDEKMRSLVRVYETMKPKDAARIFEQLDMPVLLNVIERMKEQKFAPILAEMDVRKASAVSTEMAQRRQLPAPSVSGG